MATQNLWVDYLSGRGITQKTIAYFQIHGHSYDDRPCIRYVTIGMDKSKAYRVKFTDGNKAPDGKRLAKCKWAGALDGGQTNYRYYSRGGLGQSIQEANGVLYWASGEPDTWTLYEAAGLKNVTCSFGEGSVPDTLADDLKALGVARVIMYPDLDNAGMRAAWKVLKALEDTDIRFNCYRLPGEMGSKRDLNQLWQDVKFNAADFETALNKAAVITYDDLYLYGQDDTVKVHTAAKQTELDFGGMFHEWIDTVIRALGTPDVREGRIDRWRCPLPSHNDHNPSFRVADGDNCKMPICTCDIQHVKPASAAWDLVARAKGVDTWDDYKAHKLAEVGKLKPAKPNAPAPQEPAPVVNTPAAPLWVDSHQVFSEILDHLEGTNIPDIDFIECPMEVLHRFGGFAEMMFPKKLVYIVGISGGGKTSLAETMGEKLLRQGYDFVWYGPEWSPYEMGLRSLQRNGGAPMIAVADNIAWYAQGKKGIPENKRKAHALPQDTARNSYRLVLDMASWPGRTYYLTENANKLPLSDMLNVVRAIVTERRAAGRKVVAFFFDYLQRANKKGRDNFAWSEEVISEIKAVCEELSLVGFVMVQPRKDDSQSVRNGSELTEASGQGISDQQCNLYLAVQPVYEGGVKAEGRAKIKVVKNSMGFCGEVDVAFDGKRLIWVDKPLEIRNVDLSALDDAS